MRRIMELLRNRVSNSIFKSFHARTHQCKFFTERSSYFDEKLCVFENGKVSNDDVDHGKDFFRNKQRILVITGAGISTESGIMDMNTLKEKGYMRMDLDNDDARKRLWAQHFAIWPEICKVKPNRAHKALLDLEKQKKLQWIFTKNVDTLHHLAGNERVTELYGSIRDVSCHKQGCNYNIMTADLQTLMETENPIGQVDLSFIINKDCYKGFPPNANMEFDSTERNEIAKFKMPTCGECQGNLKHNFRYLKVSDEIKEKMECEMEKSCSLLILGTSLKEDRYIPALLGNELKKGKQILVVNNDDEPLRRLQEDMKADYVAENENGHTLIKTNGKSGEIRWIKANCGEFLEKVVTK